MSHTNPPNPNPPPPDPPDTRTGSRTAVYGVATAVAVVAAVAVSAGAFIANSNGGDDRFDEPDGGVVFVPYPDEAAPGPTTAPAIPRICQAAERGDLRPCNPEELAVAAALLDDNNDGTEAR